MEVTKQTLKRLPKNTTQKGHKSFAFFETYQIFRIIPPTYPGPLNGANCFSTYRFFLIHLGGFFSWILGQCFSGVFFVINKTFPSHVIHVLYIYVHLPQTSTRLNVGTYRSSHGSVMGILPASRGGFHPPFRQSRVAKGTFEGFWVPTSDPSWWSNYGFPWNYNSYFSLWKWMEITNMAGFNGTWIELMFLPIYVYHSSWGSAYFQGRAVSFSISLDFFRLKPQKYYWSIGRVQAH